MHRIVVEKIPVSVDVINDHYAGQVGTAIADDDAKTAAEMVLRVRLRAYVAYAHKTEPKAFITAFISEGAKPQGFLALVAEVDEYSRTDVAKIVSSRIEEGLRDAQELQEKKLLAHALPEGEEKTEQVKTLNALPVKLKDLEKELPKLKLAATQINAESPDAIAEDTMEVIEKISIETTDLKASPTHEEVTFFVKVSSMANGNATVNIQNKELGFETLTISRMVGDKDFCDFFYHASLNNVVFEVSLVFDNELASASSKTLLTARSVRFPFSEKEIIDSIINRNRDSQLIFQFEEMTEDL
ncbi:MAG: hypothetical protein IBX55_16780 [Methyloprofundus sp.]|nr:hypothetical protein [Methyloprofundus sp.]